MFKPVPLPARPFVKRVLIGMNRKRLHGHGSGPLNSATAYSLGVRDIEALAAILGDRPFLMGEKPCGADATVFGMLNAILISPLESPMRDAAAARADLVAYNERMTARYFSR